MAYLLDSDIIINFLKTGTPLPKPEDDFLYLSVVNYAEILYGIRKNKATKREQIFLNSINDLGIKILSINREIAEKFTDLKIELEGKGKKLADFDLLIASTALVNDLTLVTGNKKHFARIKKLQIA